MAVNLEQYKKFLAEKGNIEERNAIGVVDVIVGHHTYGNNLRLTELYPHVWLNGEEEKLEFDLLIELEGKSSFNGHVIKTKRTIGVEFKEDNVKKVLAQAIARRPYVDYLYIATRSWVHMDFDDLFVMGYYGIGWVIWDEDFAKMIVESRWRQPSESLRYMVERAVRIHLERVLAKFKHSGSKEKSILEFVGWAYDDR
ncbi:hypothetical protein [Thermococcus sp.]|uniref:hypothetical protein n=1 Tax=Thermococcus sp. TaxID=35749 RepID=UPI0026270A93|nr:hypothetical protein [Thermococcus sp.]